jgi:hypothetical protein
LFVSLLGCFQIFANLFELGIRQSTCGNAIELEFDVGYFPRLAIFLGNVELLEFIEMRRDIDASREVNKFPVSRMNNGRMP